MTPRRLPVRPDLAVLEREALELSRSTESGDGATPRSLGARPRSGASASDGLDAARTALAHAYGVSSWARLVLACRVTDAIWRDDLESLRELLTRHPELLHEDARAVASNWGPPMSYAANLGRDRVIEWCHEHGAQDHDHAFDRACLQGRIATASRLHALGARVRAGAVMGPCETLNASGLEFLIERGAAIADEQGDRLAPVALVLETYCRDPEGKHRCLELLARHGIALPDTPTLALHRGRIDLLESHLGRDPRLVARTFAHEEIYPPELGCHADTSLALHGAPLDGGTLLHLCVDCDEIELARWLLDRGADVNARARIDADGFGGHSALFGCAVSQPHRVGRRGAEAFARLLLDHGADVSVRASLRKRLRFVADESMHEYRGVTALSFARRFHDQDWVDPAVVALLVERGASE